MGQILDVNGDMIETLHFDNDTGKSIIQTTQDVNPYLKQIENEKKETVGGWKGDLHKVATIPLVLVEQWNQELKCNILEKKNRHLLMLKINDRDYSKLRTKEGRV